MAAGQEALPPRKRRGSPRGLILLVVSAFIVAGIVIAVQEASGGGGGPAIPAPASIVPAADRHASAALRRAANAIGFKPNTEPGVGTIESKPASAARAPANHDLLPVGRSAPGFTLQTPTGQPVSLHALRGKAVLLEFFATWCPHCAAEAPHLAQLARQFSPSRFAVVAVNADSEGAPSVFAFHRYFGLPFPAVLDPGGTTGSFHRSGTPGDVSRAYKIEGFPTFYVVDAHGRIAWRSDGEQPDALLSEQLRLARRHG